MTPDDLIKHIETMLAIRKKDFAEAHRAGDLIHAAYYSGRIEELDDILYVMKTGNGNQLHR